jgi:hypothetical protein
MSNGITLSNIADIVTLVAGGMTILGVGGLVTWSFFKDGKDGFSSVILTVFSYSIKTALCLAIIPFMFAIMILPWIFAVAFAGGDTATSPFSHDTWPLGNYIGTSVVLLFAVPVYFLICSCIYTWSFRPFKRFQKLFSGDDEDFA